MAASCGPRPGAGQSVWPRLHSHARASRWLTSRTRAPPCLSRCGASSRTPTEGNPGPRPPPAGPRPPPAGRSPSRQAPTGRGEDPQRGGPCHALLDHASLRRGALRSRWEAGGGDPETHLSLPGALRCLLYGGEIAAAGIKFGTCSLALVLQTSSTKLPLHVQQLGYDVHMQSYTKGNATAGSWCLRDRSVESFAKPQ